jgi:hypothetical protein
MDSVVFSEMDLPHADLRFGAAEAHNSASKPLTSAGRQPWWV